MMRRIRFVLPAIVALIVSAGGGQARAQENPHVRDVIYGHKFGMALTLDVLKPAKQNGAGVIFMVSGGFISGSELVDSGFFGPVVVKPFLDRGYTLFLVCHGSQPKFTVSEIVADIHRSVRFIRVHAKDYGVDGERLGIMGVSSGGFLSLTIGTKGTPGDPNAKDAVDRASSQVQAVACFCPPSDLVDYGKAGRSVVEFEPVKFVWHAFGVQDMPREEQIKVLRALSPFASITKQTPPTLIIHGDADPLVPYEQSERFDAKLAKNDVPHQLITRKNAGHVWPDMAKDFALLADWFDKYLAATGDKPRADDATVEMKKLAGTWTLVSEIADGEERDADYFKKIKWIINEDGTWKVLEDGKVKYRGKLTVDPAMKPKTIDSILAGDQEGTVVRSIYELKEDSLKHCFAVGKDRPKAFESKSGSGYTNSVFKRVNKE